MPYRFLRGESVEEGLRRIALDQIEKAEDEVRDPRVDREDAIHQVRKRCKKVRGLLRLVRPALGDRYGEENARFRDAARLLSDLRDRTAVLETLDALTERFGEELDVGALTPLRDRLAEDAPGPASDGTRADDRLEVFLHRLREARTALEEWTLDDEGFDALAGGLEKTYRRARKRMAAAYEDPSPERFHEWRKRVKYHWYHLRLLQDVWPPVMRARRGEAHRLSDLLGDDHDLVVLRQRLEGPDLEGVERSARTVVLALADRRSGELRREARPLGERLLVEKPSRFAGRVERYGEVWRGE